MSVLIKYIAPAVPAIPGTPPTPGTNTDGTPGTPTIPGIPPTPAYCVDIVTYEPTEIDTCILWSSPDPITGDRICLVDVVTPGGPPIQRINHVCFPATSGTPEIPGTPPTPGTFVPGEPGTPGSPGAAANYFPGWSGSADSIHSLNGDGEYVFRVGSNIVGAATGLTSNPAGDGYVNIEYGFKFDTDGNVGYVIENGVVIDPANYASGFTGTPLFNSASDYWVIRRTGTLIEYFDRFATFSGFEDDLVYTSTVPSTTDTMWVDASLYYGGDAIYDASLEDFGHTEGVLGQLVGFAQSGTGVYHSGVLGQLVGDTEGGIEGLAGTLDGLVGTIGFQDEANYGVNYGILQPLQGFGTGMGGQNGVITHTGVLGQLSGYASDTGHYHRGILQQLSGFMFGGMSYNIATLGQLVPGASNGNSAGFRGALSGYELFAQGHADYGVAPGFDGTINTHYTLRAYGGASAKLKLSGYTFTAHGLVTSLGEAVLTGPSCRLMASATETTMGRAYLAHGGRYVITALGGGQARMTLSGYSLHATAKAGNVGSALLSIGKHHYSIHATGTTANYGALIGILPSLIVAPSMRAQIHGPRFTLVAHGTNDPAVTYEGYSHTLMGDKDVTGVAVTHYTNYPFERIVRCGARYYGVASGGLYELTGNTYAGSQILSVMQTGETDLGDPELKRTRHLHIAGRLSQDLRVSVFARENETDVYTYDPVLGGARETRVTLGRGLQARYLAFKFENLSGQNFEIQEIGPEVDVLRRTA